LRTDIKLRQSRSIKFDWDGARIYRLLGTPGILATATAKTTASIPIPKSSSPAKVTKKASAYTEKDSIAQPTMN
jgi:hypothetical protein